MFDDKWMPPHDIGATLAVLAEQAPPSAAAVATLTNIDPSELPGGQQVDLIKALERQAAWLAAYQVQALAAMDHPADEANPDTAPHPAAGDPPALPELVPGPGEEQWTQLEVAAALRLSPMAAQRRLDVARELFGRLPETWAALAAGAISYFHALTIADTTGPLTGAQAAAVEARVLPRALVQSVGQLRRSLSRAVITADPAAARKVHEKAAAERTVDFWALPDGMAHLQMVGPAAHVAAVYTALNGLADRARRPGDDRPAPARRFDSLYAVFAAILAGGDLPTRHGQRPHINVTVAATTLLGLDERPGELAGYGPITAEVARRIAADGTWRRILYDPADGRLLHYGRTTYTPPADLQRHIIARDRTGWALREGPTRRRPGHRAVPPARHRE